MGGELGAQSAAASAKGSAECRASLESTKQKWEGAARRVAARGEPRVPRADLLPGHSGRVEGRLAGKGAPSGICARATAARDSSVRGVT